ncbi:MAG TPA: gamma-glutamyltransferase [Hyphomicrobiaceae bacterium]|nr:gamma-glutamyltransferase [Hyphomicrobiaceae bacterium]
MTHGMVCAAQPEAVEAGAEVLQNGGNAVDAAIATALVQTAVDPQMCGIAGFGSLQVYDPAKGRHACLDFYGRAPAAVRPDMWEHLLIGEAEDGFGFLLEGRVNEIGYGAITTPMTLAGFAEALKTYGSGRISLGDLIEPAARYAEGGFNVRPHVHAYWTQMPTEGRAPHSDFLTKLPATRRIYQKADGRLHGVGELLRNPDMGRTLRRVQTAGVAEFYSGSIAREITADMAANGGLITAADLAGAKPETHAPLQGTYRGLTLTSNHPPGGGVMLVEMLNILEGFDLKGMGHNSADYIATVSEAMKIATVDKDQKVGDPRFVDVPMAELTSKAYAADKAALIRRGVKTHVPRLKSKESADTTHVTVVDEHGVCASMTHTLGTPSGVVTEGLGFMYNGAMAVFDPRPGRAGSLAPGKSRFSSMAPTIIFKDGKPMLVLGAPGGTYIAMGILQVILNVVEFGMSALEAVSAARFCATSDTIQLTNRILRSTEAELVRRGYPVRRWPVNYHFAGVHAIRIMDGKLDGGADPGRDGMALAV